MFKIPTFYFYIFILNDKFRNLSKEKGTSEAAPPLTDSKNDVQHIVKTATDADMALYHCIPNIRIMTHVYVTFL